MILRCLVLLFSFAGISAYELSVLAMFRDESKYLKEWIDYHRLIGVEHFWLYNDHSVDNWQDVLQEYLDAGIVDLVDWVQGGERYDYTRQPAIYRDGIQRSIGKTSWLAIIDIDEFLVPMRDQTVTQCLNKYYSKADAVYVNWRNFGTSKITVPEGESILCHLTAASMPGHPDNNVGKCILKPEKVILDTLWTPHHFDLVAGARYANGNGDGLVFEGGKFECLEHTSRLLRINHYVFRDEFFFWNFRYPRNEKLGGSRDVLFEHYESFCKSKDFAIMRFAKKLYPAYFYEKK